jgi:hypothetical protein
MSSCKFAVTRFSQLGALHGAFLLLILIFPVRECGAGGPVGRATFAGTANTAHPNPSQVSANARLPKQFGLYCLRRETYVCSPIKFGGDEPVATCLSGRFTRSAFAPDSCSRTVASRHSLHPRKNGPLSYVNSAKVGEEKQGCRNPGNGRVVDPANTHTPWSFTDKIHILRRTYFSRTIRADLNELLSP